MNEHEYLADGMAEELINLLANSANWQVTARNLTSGYRGADIDIRKVGAELGVSYAVEGSVRAMGQRVRISVALISTSDGTQIWSERYDRPLDELFELVIDSSEVGLRKPNPAIYHMTLEQLGVNNPAESLFVDDFPQNVIAAQSLGMKGLLVNHDPQDTVKSLQDMLDTVTSE